MSNFSDLAALGIPNVNFTSKSVFSSNIASEQYVDETNDSSRKAEDFCFLDQTKFLSENQYQEILNFKKSLPNDKNLKQWIEMLINTASSRSMLEKVLINREYDLIKDIQLKLNIKPGYIIKMFNWIKQGNIQQCNDRKRLSIKYKEPLGKYPRITYYNDEFLTDQEKAQMLACDLEKDIGKQLILEDNEDLKRFIEHMEYCYNIKLMRKVYSKLLGMFYYECNYEKECKFHINLTRYSVNHYIVMVKHNFLHSHDPWAIKETTKIKKRINYNFDMEQKNRVNQSQINELGPPAPEIMNSLISRKRGRPRERKPIGTLHQNPTPERSTLKSKRFKKNRIIEVIDSDDDYQHKTNGSEDFDLLISNVNFEENKRSNKIHKFDQCKQIGAVKSLGNGTSLFQKIDEKDILEICPKKEESISPELQVKSNNESLMLNAEYQISTPTSPNFPQLPSDILTPLTYLIAKYLPMIRPLKIPESYNSEIQFQIVCELDENEILYNFLNELDSKKECGGNNKKRSSYSDQIRYNMTLQSMTKSSNEKLRSLYEFLTLQEALDANFKKSQKSYTITHEGKALGMYIDVRPSSDIIHGKVYIDMSHNLKAVFEAKTILVWQKDIYDEMILAAVFVIREYTTEIIIQFLKQLKTIKEVNEITLNCDSVFIEAVISFIKNESGTLKCFIESEDLMIDTQKIVDINSQAAKLWEGGNSQNKEAKEELNILINMVSSKIDKVWKENQDALKQSPTFDKDLITKYRDWWSNNNDLKSKDFTEIFEKILEPLPLNREGIKSQIMSILGYNHSLIFNIFVKKVHEESKGCNNKIELSSEESFISNICKRYQPDHALKVFTNFIKSKCCKVEMPNSAQIGNKLVPLITIKEPIIDQCQFENLDENPNIVYKDHLLHPKSLICTCSATAYNDVACPHKIVYLISALKLDINLCYTNKMLIKENLRVKKTSRIKQFYTNAFVNLKDLEKLKNDSCLTQLQIKVDKIIAAQNIIERNLHDKLKKELQQKATLGFDHIDQFEVRKEELSDEYAKVQVNQKTNLRSEEQQQTAAHSFYEKLPVYQAPIEVDTNFPPSMIENCTGENENHCYMLRSRTCV